MARWETSSASLARIVVNTINFLSEVFTGLLPLILFRESRGTMKETFKFSTV
jgi:hypothetical protein